MWLVAERSPASREAEDAMPVQPGTSIDPEATRWKVLVAASELFYDRGVHAVGVNEIAAHARVSKLSIYRYFGSKDGLVEAVHRERSYDSHARLRAETLYVEPGRERLLAMFERITEWARERGYRGCPVVNTATDTRGDTEFYGNNDEIKRLSREHFARYRATLEENLEAACVLDPSAIARQLLLLIEGATIVTAIDGTDDAGHDAYLAAATLIDCAIAAAGHRTPTTPAE
jgi:AcrR family transcriptional regulator